MLVLSRKQGQSIVIPRQEVIVTVLGVSQNRVRIGISAPAHVKIYRGELCGAPEPSRSAVAAG